MLVQTIMQVIMLMQAMSDDGVHDINDLLVLV
jgi:hypothetical protein